MKKKFTAILVIVLMVLALGATAVFASDSGSKDENGIISSMFDAMRNWSQQAQAKGEITKQQADSFNQHFDAMEKYHEQYGLGGCGIINNYTDNGSNSSAWNSDKQSNTPGFGGGMMGNGGMMGRFFNNGW